MVSTTSLPDGDTRSNNVGPRFLGMSTAAQKLIKQMVRGICIFTGGYILKIYHAVKRKYLKKVHEEL